MFVFCCCFFFVCFWWRGFLFIYLFIYLLHLVLSNTNDFKKIYLIHRYDPSRYEQPGSKWTWSRSPELASHRQMQFSATPKAPGIFLLGKSYSLQRIQSTYSKPPLTGWLEFSWEGLRTIFASKVNSVNYFVTLGFMAYQLL